MYKSHIRALLTVGMCLAVLCMPRMGWAGVDLQLRLDSAGGCGEDGVGSEALVGLYAIFDGVGQPDMKSMDVVIEWDPTKLLFKGRTGFIFSINYFPDDRSRDGVNADKSAGMAPLDFWSGTPCEDVVECSPMNPGYGCRPSAGCCIEGQECDTNNYCRTDQVCNLDDDTCPGFDGCCDPEYCEFTDFPFNDGNLLFQAVTFGSVTALPGNGRLVTRFRFEVLDAGASEVSLATTGYPETPTLVLQDPGPGPNINVFGEVIGPDPAVNGPFDPPVVSGVGSRYLSVDPGTSAGSLPVALSVAGTGDASCVGDLWVQADGTLDSTPVEMTGAEWGTVFVHSEEIIPNTDYDFRTACLLVGNNVGEITGPATGRTWVWADCTGEGVSDVDDLLLILDGFGGFFVNATFENVNLLPCDAVPGFEVIDVDDVLAGLDGFASVPYTVSCSLPCP